MPDIYLHKFKFFSFDIPASIYLQSHRIVNAFSETGQLDRIWQQLQLCRVLKFKRDFYPFDYYVLLSVLAERYPQQCITTQIVPVKSKEGALHQILANILINSICQIQARSAPAFERAACEAHETERLFCVSKWAKILAVHRSTLYVKQRTSALEDTTVIDTASVLKTIPIPTPGASS